MHPFHAYRRVNGVESLVIRVIDSHDGGLENRYAHKMTRRVTILEFWSYKGINSKWTFVSFSNGTEELSSRCPEVLTDCLVCTPNSMHKVVSIIVATSVHSRMPARVPYPQPHITSIAPLGLSFDRCLSGRLNGAVVYGCRAELGVRFSSRVHHRGSGSLRMEVLETCDSL